MRRILKDEQGQDLVEYSLLLAFVMFTVAGLITSYDLYIAGVAGITNQNLAAAAAVIR